MTISNIYPIVYLVLATVPFSFLQYYPFLTKLRVSKTVIASIYGALLVSELVLFHHYNYIIVSDFLILFYLLHIILSLVVVRSSFYKQLFVTLVMVIYQLLLVGVSIACERWTLTESGLPPYLIANLLLVLQFALTYQIFFKFLREKISSFVRYEDDTVWRWIWLVPTCILAIILATKQFTIGADVNLYSILVRLFAGTGALACCLILVDSIEAIREKERLKSNLKLTEKLQKVQAYHYECLYENMASTRRMRHDLRHQFVVLQNYLENERAKEALAYLYKYQGDLSKQESTPLCVVPVLDALLKNWQETAANYGIKTDMMLELPPKLPVDDFDLCVLVGNLLENASEACQCVQQNERNATLKMRVIGNILVLTLDNTFNGKCVYSGNKLLSSKREYREPGIGLASVEDIANKYQGELQIKQKDNIFCVSVLLNGAVG